MEEIILKAFPRKDVFLPIILDPQHQLEMLIKLLLCREVKIL